MLVVATAFETDARSKTLSPFTGDDSGSKVKRPKPRCATSCPPCVTAIAAPGKARAWMAFSRISNDRGNTDSCSSKAGVGPGFEMLTSDPKMPQLQHLRLAFGTGTALSIRGTPPPVRVERSGSGCVKSEYSRAHSSATIQATLFPRDCTGCADDLRGSGVLSGTTGAR